MHAGEADVAARNAACVSACRAARPATTANDANVNAVSAAVASAHKLSTRVNPLCNFIVDKAHTLSFADYYSIKETPFVLIV
jgi:hypothetical protein